MSREYMCLTGFWGNPYRCIAALLGGSTKEAWPVIRIIMMVVVVLKN